MSDSSGTGPQSSAGRPGEGSAGSAGFATLLIANRGEIARRVIRSAQGMGIRCVAVYVDADSDAPFVQDADEAVRVETSYLDAAAMLEAAQATEADAVHPGYGFLSENADFATRVIQAGMAWVGPAPEVVLSCCRAVVVPRLPP